MEPSAEPPRTVKSPALRTALRPSISVNPMIMLEGRTSMSSSLSYVAAPASSPISRNVPGSEIISIRSRTVFLPRLRCSAMPASPPIWAANALRLFISSISGCQTIMLVLFVICGFGVILCSDRGEVIFLHDLRREVQVSNA